MLSLSSVVVVLDLRLALLMFSFGLCFQVLLVALGCSVCGRCLFLGVGDCYAFLLSVIVYRCLT